jgi:hypothetical protein
MESSNASSSIMNASDISEHVVTLVNAASEQFHKIPGSAIFLRYVQSSYQNDPVRSAVELFLVLFAIRYLLAPKYSTKPNYVKLSEEVGDANSRTCAYGCELRCGCTLTLWGFRRSTIWWMNGSRSRWWEARRRWRTRIWRRGRS